MKWHSLAVAAALAGVVAGCARDVPTGASAPEAGPSLARGGNPTTVARKTSLLTGIPISQGTFAGTLSITHIGYDPETGQLLFSGTVTRTADGVSESFTDVPGMLTHTDPTAAVTQQFGSNEPGMCDILFLDIGPISLDLLGLVLDLSPIQLDLDADPGPGNLLGNLLCAVTGLLDGGGLLSQITGLLDRINSILDLLAGL
jgi:hypothetical protein